MWSFEIAFIIIVELVIMPRSYSYNIIFLNVVHHYLICLKQSITLYGNKNCQLNIKRDIYATKLLHYTWEIMFIISIYILLDPHAINIINYIHVLTMLLTELLNEL